MAVVGYQHDRLDAVIGGRLGPPIPAPTTRSRNLDAFALGEFRIGFRAATGRPQNPSRCLLHNLPVAHVQDAPGDGRRLGVVRDHQRRLPQLLVRPPKHLEYGVGVLRVQVAGRLVAAAFSFYPTKNLGAYGEGGALTTDDDQIAKFARAARSHGQTARYEHEFVGYNYRMHGFQGAVLRIKLRRLYAWTARRQEIAREYRRLLAASRVEMPVDDSRDECVYHQFVIYASNRNSVIAHLTARDIETVVHYPKPVHLQPAYSSLGLPPGTFPQAERACERVLSLPVHPRLTAEQIAYVANSVREAAGEK